MVPEVQYIVLTCNGSQLRRTIKSGALGVNIQILCHWSRQLEVVRLPKNRNFEPQFLRNRAPYLVARFPNNRNCKPRFLRNRATSSRQVEKIRGSGRRRCCRAVQMLRRERERGRERDFATPFAWNRTPLAQAISGVVDAGVERWSARPAPKRLRHWLDKPCGAI